MAIEAALVIPLLVMLLLGMLEAAMLIQTSIGLGSAVRSGARTASAEPRMAAFATDAAAAVARAGTGIALGDVQELWLYRANDHGLPGAAVGGFPTVCPAACIRFRYDARLSAFTAFDGSWPADQVDACVGSADAVGVRVLARHRPLASGLLGPQTLSQRAVMRFEPAVSETGRCRP